MEEATYPTSLRKLRIYFVLLVASIPLRLMALRAVLENGQCAGKSWEPMIPLAFALLDYLWVQRRKRYGDAEDDEDATVYDIWERRITQAPYRYLVTMAALCLASLAAANITSSPASTRICPASMQHRWSVPVLQLVGTILDVCILYSVERLLNQSEGRGTRSPALRFSGVGWACLVSYHNPWDCTPRLIILVLGDNHVYYRHRNLLRFRHSRQTQDTAHVERLHLEHDPFGHVAQLRCYLYIVLRRSSRMLFRPRILANSRRCFTSER